MRATSRAVNSFSQDSSESKISRFSASARCTLGEVDIAKLRCRAGEFTCGVDPLDRYFREQAGQDVRRRATACFVAREIATDRIAGFYTLAAGGVLLAQMPVRLAKRLPRYPAG